ncbi:MAG: CpsB/CapC family capsule biosynthesis tyrosine phosphatase [candidate division WOR-3 bacterium]
MVDIHTHILPGVDDGLNTWEEFNRAIDLARANRIEKIVATPHVIDGRLAARQIEQVLMESREKIGKDQVEIYFGAEISLLWAIDKLRDQLRDFTINKNGRTLLIELPYTGRVLHMKDFFKRLRDYDFIPVISHIERYPYLEIEDYWRLREAGVYFQSNIGSFIGNYGAGIKSRSSLIYQNHFLSLLASDIHTVADYFNLPGTRKRLEKILTPDQLTLYFEINPENVIKGKELLLYG